MNLFKNLFRKRASNCCGADCCKDGNCTCAECACGPGCCTPAKAEKPSACCAK